MKGLWNVNQALISPGRSMVVYNGLLIGPAVFFTCLAILYRSKNWPDAWILCIGMCLLTIWFILQFMESLLRYEIDVHNAAVAFSYIFLYPTFECFKVLSEVFVLWGIWRINYRWWNIRPKAEPTYLILTATTAVMLFLGLYQLILRFALAFAWLNASDLHTINAIAAARSGVDVAYTALQFCFSIAVFLWTLDEKEDKPQNCADKTALEFARGTCLCLVIRSFSEVVIVGQLNRYPAHIRDIFKARDVTYGLFSMFFFFPASLSVPAKDHDGNLRKREEDALEDVRSKVLRRLEESTNGGERTAPAISSLLDSLELNIQGPNSFEADTKREEIKRLKSVYAGWEPIYKWQEHDLDPRSESLESLFQA